MWNRRRWGALCASGLLSSTGLGAHAQGRWGALPGVTPPKGAVRLVLAVHDKASFCVLPLTVAERLGYFAAEGLDVLVREYPDALACAQSVAGGASQVLSTGYATAVALRARGALPLTAFVQQGRAPQLVMGVADQAAPLALKGARIGLASMNTDAHRVARLVLHRAGLKDGDVSFVPLRRHAQAVAAFRTGQVDAICYTDPTVTLLEQEGAIKVVADTRTVRGNAEVFGGPLPAACLAAPEAFLERHPDEAQALSFAMVRALKWLQTAGPSDIIRVVPEAYFLGDRALYLAAFSRVRESWTPDGLMPAAGPATFLKTVQGLGEMPETRGLDMELTYTNRFAQKAKARFRA